LAQKREREKSPGSRPNRQPDKKSLPQNKSYNAAKRLAGGVEFAGQRRGTIGAGVEPLLGIWTVKTLTGWLAETESAFAPSPL
jgi:hypothetical protein